MQACLCAEASQTNAPLLLHHHQLHPRLLPALVWPPASACRLQRRQSQLPKSKQPQKHKTASPSVFSIFYTMWRQSICCAFLLCFGIPSGSVAAVSLVSNPLMFPLWRQTCAAQTRRPAEAPEQTGSRVKVTRHYRQDKDGGRAQRRAESGDRRRGCWLGLAFLSLLVWIGFIPPGTSLL